MITLRILCAVLAVVATQAEDSQGGAAASATIYREAVVKSSAPAVAKAVSHSVPHSSVGHGPASHGITSHSPVSHGPVSHGLLSHGPVSHGTASYTPVSQGVVSHGPVSHGPASHGAVSHGPVSHGAVSHGPVSHGAVGYGPVSHGVGSHGAVSHGPASHGAVSHGPVSHGVVSHGAASHGAVSHGPVSHGAVSHGPASHGAVSHGAVGYDSVAHGPLAQAPVVHAPVAAAAAVPSAPHGSGYQAPVLSQYHAQDDYGRYTFGYNALDSARDESRDAYGNVHGSFSYVDSYGNIQTQHYIADDYGFRVRGTNLPVHHQTSQPAQRYKRSYTASLPASTGILGPGSYAGPVSTANRVVNGPVVVSYSTPYGYDNSIQGIVSVRGTHGYGDTGAGGFISPLLGNADLHDNFDRYGSHGFSYGFQTGPSSFTSYGSHFDQQNRGYGY